MTARSRRDFLQSLGGLAVLGVTGGVGFASGTTPWEKAPGSDGLAKDAGLAADSFLTLRTDFSRHGTQLLWPRSPDRLSC